MIEPNPKRIRFALHGKGDPWVSGLLEPRSSTHGCSQLYKLGNQERAYAESLNNPRRWKEFVQGRVLLHEALIDVLGQDSVSAEISVGAPRLTDQGVPAAQIQLGLTHAPGHLCAAVSRGPPVGIDLERARPSHDLSSTADYLGWGSLMAPPPESGAWDWWTLWEASTKYLGQSVLTRDNPVFYALAAAPVHHLGQFAIRRSGGLLAFSTQVDFGVWFSLVTHTGTVDGEPLQLIWDGGLVPLPAE